MKNEHTPGPWVVCKHATPEWAPQFGVYAEGEQQDLATVKGENAKANSRLIAAAPDLLANLKSIVQWCEDNFCGEESGPDLSGCYAAIHKTIGD